MNAALLSGLDLNEAKQLLKNDGFTGKIEIVQPKETITLQARHNTAVLFFNKQGFVVDAWVS